MFTSRTALRAGLLLLGLASGSVFAAPPWASFLPFKRVEPEGQQSYQLREEQGPWLILAASFAGPGAEKQAQELVLELRKEHRLQAYIYSDEFDYTDSVDGLTINKFGERQKMRYANGGRYQAYAVLIGDFPGVDDPDLEKILEQVKYMKPECLDLEKRKDSTQRFAGLRHLYRRLNGDSAKRRKGPMGSAFVTRNPLLPDEYFQSGDVDDFVFDLNKDVEHSLLKNPGKYTVRIATFRGDDTIDARKIEELKRSQLVTDKLEVAAEQAHRLTMALRKRGIEAYEFHDRHESVVAVGSFPEQGTLLANGAIEIEPAILQLMQRFGARRQQIPGNSELGLTPRTLDGIPFDVQPLPMKVPHRAVGANYARGRSLFR